MWASCLSFCIQYYDVALTSTLYSDWKKVYVYTFFFLIWVRYDPVSKWCTKHTSTPSLLIQMLKKVIVIIITQGAHSMLHIFLYMSFIQYLLVNAFCFGICWLALQFVMECFVHIFIFFSQKNKSWWQNLLVLLFLFYMGRFVISLDFFFQ